MNSFGHIFRITSFGESHGAGLGVVVDGCPAGLKLDLEAIQHELDRRKPGQNPLTTQRKESDTFELLSGMAGAVTTGAPLAFLVRNEDQKSADYDHIEHVFRPSHADYGWFAKYGLRDHRGGGRSSARETLARVIGGAVAKQLLQTACGLQIEAWVHAIHTLELPNWPASLLLETQAQQWTRCPDANLAQQMADAIENARQAGDSLGGVIGCRIQHVPPGLGAPVFDKVHALLGHAVLSINAVKGIEFGSGFEGSRLKGSEHNDEFYMEGERVRTRTNHSGGMQGGISNGEDILFKTAFKPTSTIMQDQRSVDTAGNEAIAKGKGRHDPCVVPRAVPIVEAMAALVMADLWLRSKADRI
ncbi:MAG: chorismate synthase [Bacteroidia bacterium]|nr:chorismate synthase [Bacteroidia bacterium]